MILIPLLFNPFSEQPVEAVKVFLLYILGCLLALGWVIARVYSISRLQNRERSALFEAPSKSTPDKTPMQTCTQSGAEQENQTLKVFLTDKADIQLKVEGKSAHSLPVKPLGSIRYLVSLWLHRLSSIYRE